MKNTIVLATALLLCAPAYADNTININPKKKTSSLSRYAKMALGSLTILKGCMDLCKETYPSNILEGELSEISTTGLNVALLVSGFLLIKHSFTTASKM